MSQTAVNDEPAQAYEGKVDVSGQYPSTRVSRSADGLVYFGKYVVPLSDTELTVGAQSVKLPTTAAEVLLAANGGGIAVADPSMERLMLNDVPAPYGAYPDESMVQVLRKGRIWVVMEVAITALSNGIFVRVATPGGSPPAASLGSFTITNTANHEPVPDGFKWLASASIGGVDYGLLSVNLPG